jgi:NitT/TauT family transport system ATP-binding protein
MSVKLTAEHVWKTFLSREREVIAVQDLTLDVMENEFVSIIGPSGCGKSTFLSIAAGLELPTGGEITIDGKPVSGPGADRGMVFQTYTLFPWLTVFQNVRFALKKSSLTAAEQEDAVRRYLHLVGLDGFENAYPSQLSGGMRQRVAIARALVYKPQMLLMDEPFGALDAQTRLLMQDLLLQVWEKNRTTVLFVTHDVEEAILLSDRIYVMTARPGRLKAEVKVDLKRPRTLMETEASPRFSELRQLVLGMIREEAQVSFQQMSN